MTKQRKHLTPSSWEEEDSGNVKHPHSEAKIVGQQKIGLEPMDQELNKKPSTKDSVKEKTKDEPGD